MDANVSSMSARGVPMLSMHSRPTPLNSQPISSTHFILSRACFICFSRDCMKSMSARFLMHFMMLNSTGCTACGTASGITCFRGSANVSLHCAGMDSFALANSLPKIGAMKSFSQGITIFEGDMRSMKEFTKAAASSLLELTMASPAVGGSGGKTSGITEGLYSVSAVIFLLHAHPFLYPLRSSPGVSSSASPPAAAETSETPGRTPNGPLVSSTCGSSSMSTGMPLAGVPEMHPKKPSWRSMAPYTTPASEKWPTKRNKIKCHVAHALTSLNHLNQFLGRSQSSLQFHSLSSHSFR